MTLSEKELARIPIAPRAKRRHRPLRPVKFRVAKDPAVIAIARIVVAGLDKKHSIHPNYRDLVEGYGREEAHKIIEETVDAPGACDNIQTDMSHGGIGLFGGLTEDRSRFVFYEWTNPSDREGQLSVSMTGQEARDIVSGKKKIVRFKPEPRPRKNRR